MEMPRNGLAVAVTWTPCACRRSMTPAQLEPSANAPCTSTTVSGPDVDSWDMRAPWSSKREHEGLDARVEEVDLEQAVADRRGLPDQLVHPLVVRGAVAPLVDVDAASGPRRCAVDAHPEPHGRAPHGRPHH